MPRKEAKFMASVPNRSMCKELGNSFEKMRVCSCWARKAIGMREQEATISHRSGEKSNLLLICDILRLFLRKSSLKQEINP